MTHRTFRNVAPVHLIPARLIPARLILAALALSLLTSLPGSLPAAEFVRGDANGSGDLDMSDALNLLNWQFQADEAPACEDAADLNDSGDVDVTDPVLLLDFLFKGGRAPSLPFPACGVDPTPDDLSCTPGVTHGLCENRLVQANFFNFDDLVDDVVDAVTGDEDTPAAITGQILDQSGNPLPFFRVTHTVPFGAMDEYRTDADGFVTIDSDGGLDGRVDVVIHASNPVVKMLDGFFANLPVSQSVGFANGEAVSINAQSQFFAIADEMRRAYNTGLREFGPWNNAATPNGTGNNQILVSFPDLFPSALDFVEPASVPTGAPLIHLKDRPMTASERSSVRRHELGHALHFAKLSVATRLEFETRYVQWLIENITEPFHCMGRRTDEVVAYVEAFGMFADLYSEMLASPTKHADFFQLARSILGNANNYCEAVPATGDDVEDQVFKVIFVDFADHPAVGLDYAVSRFVDCESTTLQEYATCVRNLEGEDSEIFEALVAAASGCGISLDAAGSGLDNFFDIVDRTDLGDLLGDIVIPLPGRGEEEEDDARQPGPNPIDLLPDGLLPDLIDVDLPVFGLNITATEIPSSGTLGQTIEFSVEYTNTLRQNTTVNWNFGDGTSASGDRVTHSYSGLGTFEVRVTVGGELGSDEASEDITIAFPRIILERQRLPF